MTRSEFLATFILQYGFSLGIDLAIVEGTKAANAIYGVVQ